MIRYLLAMPREAEMFKRFACMVPDGSIEVIGIGAPDMGEFSKDDIIVNIGYAGGYKVSVGTLVEPKDAIAVDMVSERVPRFYGIGTVNRLFPLPHYTCFSSDTFVEKPAVECAAIYDMELFKIAKTPHKRLYAIKIVSDNLCESDCEDFNDEDAWKKAASLIADHLKNGG